MYGGNSTTRPGDWTCPACSNHNFSFRDVCKGCNTPRPGGSAAPLPPQLPPYPYVAAPRPYADPMGRPPAPIAAPRIGDWVCADPACGNLNFAFRNVCKQCQKPKDLSAGGGGTYPTALQGFIQPPPRQYFYTTRPGDWPCPNPNCLANNFASRYECHKCRTAKPVVAYLPPPGPEGVPGDPSAPAATASLAVGGTASVPPSAPRPGDWFCPSCRGVNFAYRKQCKFCGVAKEGTGVESRTGAVRYRPY